MVPIPETRHPPAVAYIGGVPLATPAFARRADPGYAGGMSTLDPGLEPPGDWQTPYPAQYPTPNQAGGKAAVYVWLSAGLQLAMSCCCGLTGAVLMVMSTAQITENLPHDLPNRDQALQMLPVMGPALAVGSVVLLFIPAVILGILAFQVRCGGRAATTIALVILSIQCAGLALVILNYVYALLTFQSIAILGMILVMGGVLALFVKTCFELLGVLRHQAPANLSEDGW